MTRQNSIVHFLRSTRHNLVLRLTRFRRSGTLVFVLVAVLSAVLCALPFMPVRRSVSEGTVLSADMVSRRDIVYVDDVRTEDLRKRASDEVAPDVFRVGDSIVEHGGASGADDSHGSRRSRGEPPCGPREHQHGTQEVR